MQQVRGVLCLLLREFFFRPKLGTMSYLIVPPPSRIHDTNFIRIKKNHHTTTMQTNKQICKTFTTPLTRNTFQRTVVWCNAWNNSCKIVNVLVHVNKIETKYKRDVRITVIIQITDFFLISPWKSWGKIWNSHKIWSQFCLN